MRLGENRRHNNRMQSDRSTRYAIETAADAKRYVTCRIMKPPGEIDGARVVEWAWSGAELFGEVPGAEHPEIFGLAIATYNDCEFYRFSCDRN